MTTLTKAALIERAAPQVHTLKDVPGFGDVLVRSYPESLLTRRRWQYGTGFDEQTIRIYQIIDLVMVDETTPMFTEDDFDTVAALNGMRLDPLCLAIREFLDSEEKKSEDGSNETKND